MSGLDEVLNDFGADVTRAEHLLEMVKTFREFGASTPPEAIVDGSAPWPEATALYEASKLRRTDLPVLSGSLQLYLIGRFEYCIRQIVQVIADEIASRARKYADLPDSLRTELKFRTIEVAQNPRRYGYDELQAEALLANLVENFQSVAGPLRVSSSVLSITESNMTGRVLADLLKRVGMNDYWKEVGKQATVKLHLETAADGETTVEAQSRLNSLMDERNQVAHPTSSTRFPDPDQVLKAAGFLGTIASVTVDLAKVYLASYKPTGA
jgi:hypothetical protein